MFLLTSTHNLAIIGFTSIFRLKLCAKSPRLLLEKLYVCTTMSLRRHCLHETLWLRLFRWATGGLYGFPAIQRVLRRPKSKTDFFPFLVPLDPQDPGIPGGEPGDPLGDPGCRDTGCTVVQLYWGGAWPIRDPGWIPGIQVGSHPRRDTGVHCTGYNLYLVQLYSIVPIQKCQEMSQNLKIVRSIVACRH